MKKSNLSNEQLANLYDFVSLAFLKRSPNRDELIAGGWPLAYKGSFVGKATLKRMVNDYSSMCISPACLSALKLYVELNSFHYFSITVRRFTAGPVGYLP